jgi:hypothetical protein
MYKNLDSIQKEYSSNSFQEIGGFAKNSQAICP